VATARDGETDANQASQISSYIEDLPIETMTSSEMESCAAVLGMVEDIDTAVLTTQTTTLIEKAVASGATVSTDLVNNCLQSVETISS